MKHLESILETYVYSHCNICNILIYFCNIDEKHLQHTSKTSETLETYTCNICFPAQYYFAVWTKWRLIIVELDAGVKVGRMELADAPAEALR
jgi:hypothetical protein